MFDEMMSSFMDSSIIRGLLDNFTIIYVVESSPQNVYAPESSTQNVSYGSVQTPNSRNRSGSLFCESFTWRLLNLGVVFKIRLILEVKFGGDPENLGQVGDSEHAMVFT